MISDKEIKKLGELAKLELTEKEIGGFKKDVREILDYFEELKKVDAKGAVELIHPLEPVNDFREDKAGEIIPEESKLLVEQSSDRKRDYVRVKSVFGNHE